MKLELVEALKTGHDDIDGDHERIIDTINTITHTANSGGSWDALLSLLDAFLSACEAHFRKEEGILADAGYPGLIEHTAYHDQMLAKARRAHLRCTQAECPESCRPHIQEMVELMVDDIVRSDMGFASFLQAKGLARPRR